MSSSNAPTWKHTVLHSPIAAPVAANEEEVFFALGCFWGAERAFWKLPGVVTTAVGYINGELKNPDYRSVCSGMTGHTEAVRVVFQPEKVSFKELLRCFWQSHDPTQGNRQGNDIGTQYRSGIYTTTSAQLSEAQASLAQYEAALLAKGRGKITTEVLDAPTFWYAEEYHQQYLDKNPGGYCGLGGCGVPFPSDE